MALTKTPPSMMDLSVEVPLTGLGRLRGTSDAADSLTIVGGANDTNNRMQIRGSSHPTTPNMVTIDTGGTERMRIDGNGKVNIGGAAGTAKVNVYDASNAFIYTNTASFNPLVVGMDTNGDAYVQNNANATLRS